VSEPIGNNGAEDWRWLFREFHEKCNEMKVLVESPRGKRDMEIMGHEKEVLKPW